MEKQPIKAPVEARSHSFSKPTPESSSVSKIEYNEHTQVLSLTFKSNGSIYDYPGVTKEDAAAALASKSYGSLARNELKAYKGEKRVEIEE